MKSLVSSGRSSVMKRDTSGAEAVSDGAAVLIFSRHGTPADGRSTVSREREVDSNGATKPADGQITAREAKVFSTIRDDEGEDVATSLIVRCWPCVGWLWARGCLLYL